MKLISCYIENYGALSQKEFKFSDGLNVITAPNGVGKSTLASFVRAMFYGLPAYRANSKDFEERQHFFPFNGGKFGGNLAFEWRGEKYRIERFFDEKSGKGDSVAVYKGGKPTYELGENIGKTVFGIDSDAFARSAFMSDEEREGTSGDITAKLNKYVYDEDAESTEDALKKLDEGARALKAKRGKGGDIDVLKERKRDIEDRIRALEELENTLETQYADREKLVAEVRRLEKAQSRYNEEQILIAKRGTYDGYLKDIAEVKEKLAQYKAKYPKGVPDADSLSRCADKEREIAQNNALAQNTAADPKKVERLGELEEKFALRPAAEDMERAEAAAERYKQSEAKLKYKPTEEASKKSKGGIYIAVSVLGGVLAVAGIVLCFILLTAGIALLAVGLALLAVCAFLYLKNRTEKAGDGLGEIRAQLFGDERIIRELITPYGYFSDNPVSDLQALKSEIAELEGIKAEIAGIEAAKQNYADNNARLSGEIQAVFEAYSLSYGEGAIETLSTDSREIQALLSRYGELKAKAEEFRKENNLAELPPQLAVNVDEELAAKRAELGRAGNRINDDEDKVAYLDDYRGRLEKIELKIAECERRYKVYTAAYAFLCEAQKRLKDKYVDPVKQRFLQYSRQIEALPDYKIVMDENFEVKFDSHGEIRDFRHFSAGQRAVCSLCLRLALIDSLYPEEKPFLVLDDPFVALDKKNMAGTAKAVRELSKDIQILYFCCHDSRKI